MIAARLRPFWREPAPPRPSSSPWWDRVLAVVAGLSIVLEASSAEEVRHRTVSALCGLLMVLPLWSRRRHPFSMFLLAFGVAALVPSVPEWVDLQSAAFILLLPYSLARWGSGKQACWGLVAITALWVLTLARGDFQGPGDAAAAALVMSFPGVLGVAVRQQTTVQQQELRAERLAERERLARELHDSVAHHVTAIVLQAQGGLLVAAQRPEEAARVLRVIEEAATGALLELRSFVRALRDDGATLLRPRAQLEELREFASSGDGAASGQGPSIEVEFRGPVERASAVIQAAAYRVAQEAITNARRHASQASRVLVVVEVDAAYLTLTVTDDGQGSPPVDPMSRGFGLVGMAERAALLGGSFEAGPRGVNASSGGTTPGGTTPGGTTPERGWRVRASFPV